MEARIQISEATLRMRGSEAETRIFAGEREYQWGYESEIYFHCPDGTVSVQFDTREDMLAAIRALMGRVGIKERGDLRCEHETPKPLDEDIHTLAEVGLFALERIERELSDPTTSDDERWTLEQVLPSFKRGAWLSEHGNKIDSAQRLFDRTRGAICYLPEQWVRAVEEIEAEGGDE
jgi:hypothetical protein